MKKVLLLSLSACLLLGAEENFIEIGGGFIKEKNNFSTNSEKTINNYKSAKSQNEGIGNLSFYYAQDISKNTNLYLGSSLGDLFLGSEIETDFGVFDIGVNGNFLQEAWENPFLLNTQRKKTDVNEAGGYIGYGVPISDKYFAMLRYQYSSKDYKNDEVDNDLKRDGKKHILSLENDWDLNDIKLSAVIFYETYNADAKASSYDKSGIEASILKDITPNLQLALIASYASKDFDKQNPILNKKIDSDTYSFGTSLKYDEPFDYENSYVSLNVGYEEEDANHNFYDRSNQYNMIAIGYKF